MSNKMTRLRIIIHQIQVMILIMITTMTTNMVIIQIKAEIIEQGKDTSIKIMAMK